MPVDPDPGDDGRDDECCDREIECKRMVEKPREVEAGKLGQLTETRQGVLRQSRPREHRRGGSDVEDREHEAARYDGRIRALPDRPMGKDDAHRVPRPERDDRIDAHPGEICADDRPSPDSLIRIRGGQHVPPRHARAGELRKLRKQREEDRERVDRRELVEKGVDPIEDADHDLLDKTGNPLARSFRSREDP